MSKTYITLTGTQYYHGKDFLKPGMRVQLVKEPDNKYDKEAIVVRLEGLGDIGHVANSVHTVVDESISAGRLYDRIGKIGDIRMDRHGVRYQFEHCILPQLFFCFK